MVLLTALSTGLGYGAIALAPWSLLPFAWFFTGTALTALFVIGHDRGHRSFARRRWLNDWIGTLALSHFNPCRYAAAERPKVRASITFCGLFAFGALPWLLLQSAPWAVVSFWLLPWLVFHFWMGSLTRVHHTHPESSFQSEASWNVVEAQRKGTVQGLYPGWMEGLCQDINLPIPHPLSVAIPACNLRLAQAAVDHRWGSVIQRQRFSGSLMRRILAQCQRHDPDEADHLASTAFAPAHPQPLS